MRLAIKKALEAKKMTVDELADKSGLTKTMIWNYESGRNNPKIDDLCGIADILECSLDMLVRGKEKDRPKGRSASDVLKEYDEMSEVELHRMIALLQAVLADKQFQAHLRQDGQEAP